MAAIFITGNSNGLGLGLSRYYLQQGDEVYGLSRSQCPIQDNQLHQQQCDLHDFTAITEVLSILLPKRLDLVILNAGILGKIQDLHDSSLQDIREVMDINLWANKIIIDYLINNQLAVDQLILVSSGASVNGNRGWGAYSISKAALNMMAKLYAHEMPQTHITAYAPGLIHTRMQDYLCHDVDTEKFPSITSLVNAYQTENMPGIDVAAEKIAQSFSRCLDQPSGSFIDIRQL